jgi:hypothetical protein
VEWSRGDGACIYNGFWTFALYGDVGFIQKCMSILQSKYYMSVRCRCRWSRAVLCFVTFCGRLAGRTEVLFCGAEVLFRCFY